MPRPLKAHAVSNDLRYFTNREKEQDVLRRLLDVPAGLTLPIVMFYGVGGAGKSLLLKKLQSQLPANMPAARLDFDPSYGGVSYHTDQARALAELRRQLGEKRYQFPLESQIRWAPGMDPSTIEATATRQIAFPRFDLAYAFLRFKEHGKDEPQFRGSGFLGGSLEFLAEATEALADFPGVNLATWAAKKIAKPVWNQVKDTPLVDYLRQKLGEADFLELRKLSPQDIYPQLLDRFLEDLAEGAPPRGDEACRAVILLDTVEALRLGLAAEAHVSRREQWLRDLHRTNSPVLLLLAGRDQLRWGDADPDYRDRRYLEQHLVGGLSDADARSYLGKCGIHDTALQDAVMRVAIDTETVRENSAPGYHGFSLGLCQDTICAAMERGHAVDPASFDMSAGDYTSMAKRFLVSLASQAMEVWVRKLALTPRFDEAGARAAFSVNRDVHQDAAWLDLRGFSFLRETDEPGWYTLHARMHAALNETSESVSSQIGHREWEQHWQKRSTCATDGCAGLAWFHRYCQDRREARMEWKRLAETLRNERRMSEHFAVLAWWDPVHLDAPDPEDAEALNSLGVELWRTSLGNRTRNLNDAIACYDVALRACTEKDFPSGWAMIQNNLGNAYCDLVTGARETNLRKAITCYEAALRVRTETAFPFDWATTQNNLGIAYTELLSEENLAKSIACYEAALRVFTERDFPAQWAWTQNNLGNANRIRPTGDPGENLAKAFACYEAALRVRTEKSLPTAWAMTQHNLGFVYCHLPTEDRKANLRMALAHYEAAQRIHTEKDFPVHWAMTREHQGITLEILGDIVGESAAYQDAIQCWTDAARGYSACGLDQKAEGMCQLAERLQRKLAERIN